jgi:peptide/nickel transport system permease protein
MVRYVLRRVLQTLLTLWAILTLVFVLVRLVGDPLEVLAPEEITVQQKEELRQALGLDQPLPVQYLRYLQGVLRLDLGISYYTGQPALALIAERFPVTLLLVVGTMALSVALGFPFGLWAALRPGSLPDRLLRTVSVMAASIPSFVLGIFLIFTFSVSLNWLPSSGWGSWGHLVLPAVVLSLDRIALFTRLVRSGLLGELSQDYVRTAWSKGLHPRVVIFKHALRTAAIPLVTVLGLQFGQLLGGAVVTETLFALPGMNRLALEAIYRLDYPIILAYVLVVAALFSLINLVVDLTYAWLDPRVAHE